MENIQFDSGVKEYRINGTGVLRFNPSDPNLYARFLDALDKVKSLEQELTDKAREMDASETRADNGEAVLRLMQDADRQIKAVLAEVFGAENDFDRALGGVNLLAVAENGERVLTNLLAALQPILVAGAEAYADRQADAAVAQAKQARAKRGAKA